VFTSATIILQDEERKKEGKKKKKERRKERKKERKKENKNYYFLRNLSGNCIPLACICRVNVWYRKVTFRNSFVCN